MRLIVSGHRVGITVIELMVAVGILGILASLLFPAIQYAREASRMTTCKSNLKQIGIATNDFHSRFRKFPDDGSPLRDLLKVIDPTLDAAIVANKRESVGPSIYGCPSDWKLDDFYPMYRISYFYQQGWRIGSQDGMVPRETNARTASEIIDGLSNTVGFGERLLGFHGFMFNEPSAAEKKRHPIRQIFLARNHFDEGQEDELLEETEQLKLLDDPPVGPNVAPYLGMGSRLGSENYYTHLSPPNNWTVSLLNGSFGSRPASSLHSGGVHIVYLDGHVSFVANQVVLKVWRAISTVAGHETVDQP